MSTIYCIHCSITGKKYVGMTRGDVNRRILQHRATASNKSHNHRRLYQAIKKYGWENFIWGVVTECEAGLENETEMCYVKSLGAYPGGYNCDWGGTSCVHSEETKKKMSATWKAKGTSNRKGKKNSPESNEKRRQTLAKRKALGLPVGCPKGTVPWNKK